MYKSTRIPRLNPVRFIVANDSLPASYNNWPFDRGFYEQQLQSWQKPDYYQQKWNTRDKIQIYLDSLAPGVILHVLNEYGEQVAQVDYTGFGTLVPDNNAPSGDPYYTYTPSFRLPVIYPFPAGTEQQILYFVIEHVYGSPGDADSVYSVSEPQFFREKWEDTVWMEYTHSITDFDVYFETFFTIFGKRFEGFIEMDQTVSNDTAFVDQQYVSRTLESVPYETFKLTAGGPEGLPGYERSKINRALSCNKIKFDGVRYTKDTNAKLDSKEIDIYARRIATIQLQEYIPNDGATTVSGGLILLLALPMSGGDISFPFAMTGFGMEDDIAVKIDSTKRVIENLSSLTSYIGYLNSFFSDDQELIGTFSIQESAGIKFIAYNNGINETYHTLPGFWAWDKCISVGVAITGTNIHYEFMFAGAPITAGIGKVIVDWGDGHVEAWSSSGAGGTDYGATQTATHTYAGAIGDTEYNLRVFHAGTSSNLFEAIFYFGFEYASAAARIFTNYNGTNIVAPKYLRVYSQQNQAIYGSGNQFDYRFLLTCQTELRKLYLNSSNISHFTVIVMPIPYTFPDPVPHWTLLKTINFNGNHLLPSELDDFITNSYFHLLESLGGFMDLRQLPAAVLPVTPTCGTYLSNLTGIYAWTINYDS